MCSDVDLVVSVLDVGHGNSSVITEGNSALVIDGGPGASLLQFIEDRGIERLDFVLVSHADSDHIGGLISVIESETVSIGAVYVNSDSQKNSQLWDRFLKLLEFQKKRDRSIQLHCELTTSHSGKFDGGKYKLEVLAPSFSLAAKGPGSVDLKGRSIETNTISAVFRLVREGKPIILFAGDLDLVGIQNLEEVGNDIQAPILVFPHHGGRLSNSSNEEAVAKLCRLVNPREVIFSLHRSRYNNPRDETISAIRSCGSGIGIRCTQLSQRCGDIPASNPTHLGKAFAQGRDSGVCCSGTIELEFRGDAKFALTPTREAHQEFIQLHVSSPRCG